MRLQVKAQHDHVKRLRQGVRREANREARPPPLQRDARRGDARQGGQPVHRGRPLGRGDRLHEGAEPHREGARARRTRPRSTASSTSSSASSRSTRTSASRSRGATRASARSLRPHQSRRSSRSWRRRRGRGRRVDDVTGDAEAVGDRRSQLVRDLRYLAVEPRKLAVEEHDELHRRLGDDGRGPDAAEEHGDLAEHVARAERPDELAVLEDVGVPGRHGEHRVAELALLREGRAGVDLELAARSRDAVALPLVEIGKHRDRADPRRVHPRDANSVRHVIWVTEW